MDYIKSPDAIYEASFRTIVEEVDFEDHDESIQPVLIRLIHACGMTNIVNDLSYDVDLITSSLSALVNGAPILCDCEMVRHGVIARNLPAKNQVICHLNNPQVAPFAKARRTTRSAAQVALWTADLDGAIVVIGNAPTCLFALLEALDEGAPRPAAILGFPVGFVGAAESKQELAENPRNTPFITLKGRRGGSAMAAAALNALAIEAGKG